MSCANRTPKLSKKLSSSCNTHVQEDRWEHCLQQRYDAKWPRRARISSTDAVPYRRAGPCGAAHLGDRTPRGLRLLHDSSSISSRTPGMHHPRPDASLGQGEACCCPLMPRSMGTIAFKFNKLTIAPDRYQVPYHELGASLSRCNLRNKAHDDVKHAPNSQNRYPCYGP